jgi:hypothetical protein
LPPLSLKSKLLDVGASELSIFKKGLTRRPVYPVGLVPPYDTVSG